MGPRQRKTSLVFFVLLSFCLLSTGGLRAEEQSAESVDSSECINCHTDLEEMDEYGAQAASASAAVAG